MIPYGKHIVLEENTSHTSVLNNQIYDGVSSLNGLVKWIREADGIPEYALEIIEAEIGEAILRLEGRYGK